MAKKGAKSRVPQAPVEGRFCDRVVELRRVRCGDIEPHPLNPRRHPVKQLAAITGLLLDVGKAAPLIAFPADGKGKDGDFSCLMYWDGHGRRVIDLDEVWPVVVTDLTRAEADEMALAGDYSATLAELDPVAVEALMRDVQTASEDVAEMLTQLAEDAWIVPGSDKPAELRQLDTLPPPKMSWVLIGIPTVRFGEIAETIEQLGGLDGIILETTANDG